VNTPQLNRRSALSLRVAGVLLGTWAFVDFASGSQPPGSPNVGPSFTLLFDEKGNGVLTTAAGSSPAPGVPVAGGGIRYFLPVVVSTGDVIIRGPSDVSLNNPNGFSDLLTFTNDGPGGNGVLLYRSLIDDLDSFPDPADVLGLVAPTVPSFTDETGPEGSNGFVWLDPTGGNIGDPTIYRGISDGTIPEPSSFILGGSGLLALVLIGCRRRLMTGPSAGVDSALLAPRHD
jgi:hypothetical protein